MHHRRFVPYLGMMIVMVSAPALAADRARELSERQKVEDLLGLIENLGDARFVRDGTDLDAPAAARFLRSKWEFHRAGGASARDFVRICSASGTGDGPAYLIRNAVGDTPASAFLNAHLAGLESRRAD